MNRTIYSLTQKGLDYLRNRKYYAAITESIHTVLAEFDTEQDRQDWLNYNTEYDKMYGNAPSEQSRRIPMDDNRIINRFTDNPKAEHFADENIPRLMWYALI